MAQHEVRAELTRIFGVGNWDNQVESMDLLWEREVNQGEPGYPQRGDGKPYYIACYKAAVRLNIRDYWGNPVCSFVEYHAEANSVLPDRGEAHAMAITSVESYALRRAAIGLGDRLGLGLYNKGLTAPLVKGSLLTYDPESPLYIDPEEVARERAEQAQKAAEQAKHSGATEQAQQFLTAGLNAQVVDSGPDSSGEAVQPVEQYAEGMGAEA
jgi:Rad52/22 family double-strand break repair protein